MLELLPSVLHVPEQVEAGAAGAEQHRVARTGHLTACLDTVGHGVGVAHGKTHVVERGVELGVVGTETLISLDNSIYRTIPLDNA
jgi:hypothetical protein